MQSFQDLQTFSPLSSSSYEAQNKLQVPRQPLGLSLQVHPKPNQFLDSLESRTAGGHKSLWNGTSDRRTPDFGSTGSSACGRKWISSHSQQPSIRVKRPKKCHPERMKQILRTRRCLIICDSASTLTHTRKTQDFCHQLQGIMNPTGRFYPAGQMWVRIKSPKPAFYA